MAFGKLFVDLALRDKGFRASLKAAGGSVDGLEKKAISLDKVIGKSLVRSFQVAGAAMAAFGVASAKIGTDFEHSITLVKSLSRDGVDNFKALEDEARRLGSTTEFSARQAASAMTNFARAGMRSREVIAATGPALLMAGGAGESMTLATMSMAASLKQFSLDAEDSGHVADVFTVALKRSLFNLQGLNDAMKYAGPAGAAFGMSIEQTTAAVAQFRDMGLDASMAGTAFRMALNKLAKRTPEFTKVMVKYGLTVADVSMETNTFQEVLANLAGTSINAEDALKMFGARAGSNMSLLIDKMRDADFVTEFDDLTKALYRSSDGAGAAKKQYDEMGKTVLRQAKIARSAFEELLLKVFDTYRGPLQEFLAELAETIQYVGETFAYATGMISNDLGGALQTLTQYLKENKDKIAVWFLAFHGAAQQAIKLLSIILPLFESIASVVIPNLGRIVRLMVYIFALGKVTALTSALALTSGATFTLAGAWAAVTASTLAASRAVKVFFVSMGPLGWAVLGIGVFVEAFNAMAGSADHAKESIDALHAAQKKVTEDAEVHATVARRNMRKLIKVQQEKVKSVLRAMEADGASAEALTEYEDRVRSLTTKEALLGVETGKLVEIQTGLYKGVFTATEAYRILGDDGIDFITLKAEALREEYDSQSASLDKLESGLANYNKTMAGSDVYSKRNQKAWMESKGGVEAFTLAIKEQEVSVGDLFKKLKAVAPVLKTFRQLMKEAIEEDAEDRPKDKEKGKSRKDQLDELLKYERDYQLDLASIGEDGIEKAARALDAENNKINDKFDNLLKEKDRKLSRAFIEGQRKAALASAMAKSLKEQDLIATQNAIDQETAAQERKDKFISDHKLESVEKTAVAELAINAQRVFDERAIERDGIELTNAQKEALDAQFRSKQIAAVASDIQTKTRLDGGYTAIQDRIRLKGLIREDKHQKDRIAHEDRFLAEKESLENKSANVKKEMLEGETVDVRHAAFLQLGIIQDQLDDVENERRRLAWKLVDLNDDAIKREAKATELAGHAKVQAAIRTGKRIQAALRGILLKEDKPERSILAVALGLNPEEEARLKKKIKKRVDLLKKLFINPLKAIASKAINIFKSMSGFQWDVGSMVDDASAMKADQGQAAVDAEADRRQEAGLDEMTADEESTVRAEAESKFDPKEAARKVADEQAQAMMDRFQMAIDMIPVFIAKLAEHLPVLVEGFVASFPAMIKSLVSALSGPDGLIMVIANALPDIIVTVVESLPKLIKPLVNGLVSFLINGLPQIVNAVVGQLPFLITALFDAIPKIINGLILGIIKMIPVVIPALIEAVIAIVVGFIEAIPIIIGGFIKAIPVLIIALVDAIPGIITALISAIPEIVTAVVMAIPTIVFALIEAIPIIIMALVKAVPTIIMALWKGIGEIITAIFVTLPAKIGKAIREGFSRAWKGMKKGVGKLWSGIKDSKLNPKNWFGDTPGPMRVGPSGGAAHFAPGDFMIAAQKPLDLLGQALSAVADDSSGGASRAFRGPSRAAQRGMMASPVPLAAAMAASGGMGEFSSNIALKVQIEGETIDQALITSKGRGTAPKMWDEISRISGATTGFERD